jgi:hypothetical protein
MESCRANVGGGEIKARAAMLCTLCVAVGFC